MEFASPFSGRMLLLQSRLLCWAVAILKGLLPANEGDADPEDTSNELAVRTRIVTGNLQPQGRFIVHEWID